MYSKRSARESPHCGHTAGSRLDQFDFISIAAVLADGFQQRLRAADNAAFRRGARSVSGSAGAW
jgi:hypothetical protein